MLTRLPTQTTGRKQNPQRGELLAGESLGMLSLLQSLSPRYPAASVRVGKRRALRTALCRSRTSSSVFKSFTGRQLVQRLAVPLVWAPVRNSHVVYLMVYKTGSMIPRGSVWLPG